MYSEQKHSTITSPLDMMNRLQVSNPTQLASYSHVTGKSPTMDIDGTGTWTHIDGGVNGTLSEGVYGIELSVAIGQSLIAESRIAHGYVKGMPQTWESTHQNFILEAGVIKRVGYHSATTTAPYLADQDGQYIESNGVDNEYYLCLFRKGVEVLKLPRSQWTDPLDGTGKSGLTIDFAGFNIQKCSFVWLGGKGASFGLSVNNILVSVYEYGHAGIKKGLIMRNPNQPIRYSIEGVSGAGKLYLICAAVQSEGSKNDFGSPKTIRNTFTVNAPAVDIDYGCIFMRLRETTDVEKYRNNIVRFNDFTMSSATSADGFSTMLSMNPTVTNPTSIPLTWLTHPVNPAVEYAFGGAVLAEEQTLTGGIEIYSSAISKSASSGGGSFDKDTTHQLSRNIDGTSNVLALSLRPDTTFIKAKGTINFTVNNL